MAASAPPDTAAHYIYDVGHRAGLKIRQLCGNLITEGPLTILSKSADGDMTGFCLWSSAPLLARYIMENKEFFAGKRVLELGAGCGLPGLVVARHTAASYVLLTEYQGDTLRNMCYNVRANCAPAPGAVVGKDDTSSAEIADLLAERFVGAGGAAVEVGAMDWDKKETWPKARDYAAQLGTEGVEHGASDLAQFEVIIAADLVPRLGYGRKLGRVLQGLLKPGGVFIFATPTIREGLPPVEAAMSDIGAAQEELVVPLDWRVNPLREAPLPEGEADGADAEGIRYVNEEQASTMFAELFVPSYEIRIITFKRPLPAEDDEESEEDE